MGIEFRQKSEEGDCAFKRREIYYLPAAAAVAVALFTPADHASNYGQSDDILAVEYLNYGIIGGVQITSLAHSPITIIRVLINNEFCPSLHAPREEGCGDYLHRGFPRRLHGYGCSFITIADAPIAPSHIRSLCYGKPVTEVKICTDYGDFAFEIGEIAWCNKPPIEAWPMRRKPGRAR